VITCTRRNIFRTHCIYFVPFNQSTNQTNKQPTKLYNRYGLHFLGCIKSVYKILIDFSLQRRSGFDPKPVCLRTVVNKVSLEKLVFRLYQFSSVTSTPQSSLPQYYTLQKDKWAKPQNLQTNQFSFRQWTALDREIFSPCFSLKYV